MLGNRRPHHQSGTADKGAIDDGDVLQGLHYAFEHDVTLFDVADYGHGRAERTLGSGPGTAKTELIS
jgi:aryl-alcohol dehydrogenase-like predicted oxidoreductase